MRPPVTLDQLEVFVAVASTGGFAGAARQIARTQSAVSKTIATLERLLDLELFVRSAQGVTLTPQGGALLASAKDVLRSADLFRAEASRVVEAEEGVISVALDVLCPAPPVYDALAGLAERFAATAVIVRTEQLEMLPRLVLSGTCAVGICGPRGIDHRDLQARYLRTTSMVPVCSAEHPLAAIMAEAGVVPRPELARHVHLYLTERADWLLPDAPDPDADVEEGRWWKLSDLHTKHGCLRRGLGWGMMPLHGVQPELRRGELVRLRVEGWPEAWAHRHHLVRRRDLGAGPAVDYLCAALAQTLHQAEDSGS